MTWWKFKDNVKGLLMLGGIGLGVLIWLAAALAPAALIIVLIMYILKHM